MVVRQQYIATHKRRSWSYEGQGPSVSGVEGGAEREGEHEGSRFQEGTTTNMERVQPGRKRRMDGEMLGEGGQSRSRGSRNE